MKLTALFCSKAGLPAIIRPLAAVLLFALASTLLLERVEACYQDSPSVQLRAPTIAGTVTLRDKVFEGALLRLRKYNGAYSVKIGHADSHFVREAVVARDGTFRFAEVPSGKYVLFVGGPSGAAINVELIKQKNGKSDTVAIENFGDSCISAKIVSVNRRD